MKPLSGVVTSNSGAFALTWNPGTNVVEEFSIPEDYPRGVLRDSPNLSGLRVMTSVENADPISSTWSVQSYNSDPEDPAWETEASGICTSSTEVVEGRAWIDIEFDVSVTGKLEREWRFQINEANHGLIYSNDSGASRPIYKVLGNVADSGTDLFGNSYRSAVVERSPSDLYRSNEKSWMSKPNPSKFAVESLYFDVSNDGFPAVVNNVMVDPITPGVYFTVYYSNGEMGFDPDTATDSEWDNLIWNRVPRTYQITQKKTFSLPEPVTTSYIKIEFTHLQAKHYSPGQFQQKVSYKKHPKWVLDYFYAIYLNFKTKNEVLSDRVTLRYNAYDLYYGYFVDDILESPNYPRLSEVTITTDIFNDFLYTTTDQELDELDATTRLNIKTSINRYSNHPIVNGAIGSSLKRYGMPTSPTSAYSTETVYEKVADTDLVSSGDTSAVILDREFPIMNFYMPCRHEYKESLSVFENDRAYFAGVREVTFGREYYAANTDNSVYTETAGDEENIESNDFASSEGKWVIV